MARESYSDLQPGYRQWIERGLFVYRKPDGSIWYGISYKAGRRRVRKIISEKKTDARRELAKVHTQIADGEYTYVEQSKIPTFEMFGEKHIAARKEEFACWESDQSAIRAAYPLFGHKRLDTITAADILDYKEARLKVCAKSTVQRNLNGIRALFNAALARGYIPKCPIPKGINPTLEEKPMRTLTKGEEEKLLAAAAPHIRPVIALSLNTGLRKSECLRLQWEDVDLDRGVVEVKKSKSKKVRHVPLNRTACETLESLFSRTGRVFSYQGEPMTELKKAFATARRKAGIQTIVIDEKTGHKAYWPRFHDLRHTFATRLVLAGVDLPTVQELLGHSNIKMTRKYAHPTPAHRRAAVELLDGSGQEVAIGEVVELGR